ncbi:DUF1826 domain-containing protein [Sphingomonas fuzhouensis]|uniref:DUF1826 domain-containing protein n=1 Tax=Sphingomonas fuzhouensis TaxID=3106033 RepID=UPI002AFF5026|nr:DUF1826 domain-containing protein [Sphingomonas sp. SGZ-02]
MRRMTAIGMERRIAIGGDSASLDRIVRPDVALAIWWRPMPQTLRAALRTLDLTLVDDVAVEIDLEGSIQAVLRTAGYSGSVLDLLGADVDRLIRRHAALTGEDRQRVRLSVMEREADARFHADCTTFGLTCTYIGPGRQWCCAEGQDAIYEVPTGAVGVFKGRTLLDPPLILHRSPPGGHPRLRLRIDPVRSGDPDRPTSARPQADPC